MSDPIPKDGGTEARGSDESLPDRLPPLGLPEELIRRRLARLDTRRALADLCKSVVDSDGITTLVQKSAKPPRGLGDRQRPDQAPR